MDFNDYARARAEGRDIVRFEVIHARMTGDAVSGLLLSQLVYWHGVNKRGKLRRTIHREGRWWVAKAHNEWKRGARPMRKPRKPDNPSLD